MRRANDTQTMTLWHARRFFFRGFWDLTSGAEFEVDQSLHEGSASAAIGWPAAACEANFFDRRGSFRDRMGDITIGNSAAVTNQHDLVRMWNMMLKSKFKNA